MQGGMGMKCSHCGEEFEELDGDNLCPDCIALLYKFYDAFFGEVC